MKIESGAKSALDPNSDRIIQPYLADDIPSINLHVGNVITVDAERTFWDKIIILHGLRRWFDIRGELRGNGQRVSRHYYDVFQLLASDVGLTALADRELGADCVSHARMFFNRPDYDLVTAKSPMFSISLQGEMLNGLRRDHQAMSSMIFGTPPSFEAIVEKIAQLEITLNSESDGVVG